MIYYIRNLDRKDFIGFHIVDQPFVGLKDNKRIETKTVFVMHNIAETLTPTVIRKCIEVAKRNNYNYLYSIKIDDDRVFIRGCHWEEEKKEVLSAFHNAETEIDNDIVECPSPYEDCFIPYEDEDEPPKSRWFNFFRRAK